MNRSIALAGLAVLAAGCAAMSQTTTAGGTAMAELKNASGAAVGRATFTEVGGGVRVVVEARGLSSGQKGVHIHEVGACEPPDFKSAGDHFNPTIKKHGLMNPEGPHAGDLPNISIGADGTGRLEAFTDRVTLGPGASSLLDGSRSLVIHAAPDDFKTDPSGNSGDRIGCGVIVKSRN